MRLSLIILSWAVFAVSPSSFAGDSKSVPVPSSDLIPGKFDSFILAVSYQNEYCRFNPTEAECKVARATTGMALHGLWPDRNDDLKNMYQYCGPTQASLGSNWWCKPELDVKGQLSAAEFEALTEAMPGTASCLDNHEWYAHGTCSGMTVAEYFDDAQKLAIRFRKLPAIQAAISAAAGSSVDRAAFFAAIETDLGTQAADSARVNCFKDRNSGTFYFSEIDFGLDRDHFMDFPAAASLAPLKPYQQADGTVVKDKGSCPETGIVVVK